MRWIYIYYFIKYECTCLNYYFNIIIWIYIYTCPNGYINLWTVQLSVYFWCPQTYSRLLGLQLLAFSYMYVDHCASKHACRSLRTLFMYLRQIDLCCRIVCLLFSSCRKCISVALTVPPCCFLSTRHPLSTNRGLWNESRNWLTYIHKIFISYTSW